MIPLAMPIFQDFGIMEALGTLFGVVWAVIFAGKQTGKIKTPADPLIAEALHALSETNRVISETMLQISTMVSKLDRQHGPEAGEGQYETWKFSPLHQRHLEAAHKKAHCAAMMAAVQLRMEIAKDEDDRQQQIGRAEAAIQAWDAVKAEFT